MDRFESLEFESKSGSAAGREADVSPLVAPADGPGFYRAARAMREAGHFQSACGYYRKAVGFNDHHYGAWVELTDSLIRAGLIEEADRVSQEVIDAYRQVRVLYAARALVLGHQGRIEQARPLSDVSIEGEQPSWYGHCVRGELMLLEDSSTWPEAVAEFERAFELAGDLAWEAAFLAGWSLLAAKLHVLAAGFFAEAAHQRPRAAACWLFLGDTFHGLQLYDQALFYYQRVTELEPTHDKALERQRRTTPMLYGLMRAFRKGALERIWQREYERLTEGKGR